MWAKGRFGHMAGFATKAKGLGFTHIEINASVSAEMLAQLLNTAVPISSIHSPCPAVLSSSGIPVDSLSLSSLNESERTEAVSFARQTIDLAVNVRAKAIILHMGEVRIDLNLQDQLCKLYAKSPGQTDEYSQVKEELIYQRVSQVPPHFDAARKSIQELGKYSRQKGIMLGLETRFRLHEIPNMAEMAELLNEVQESLVGYWHDVGHAEVQQRLGFCSHGEWLSRFKHRMIGIHLHDVLGISDHYAPGKGDINWEILAKYLPPGIVKVCEIGEWNNEEHMQGVVKFLQKKGIVN
jgi:sugar phosphate isomerase/epimerase